MAVLSVLFLLMTIAGIGSAMMFTMQDATTRHGYHIYDMRMMEYAKSSEVMAAELLRFDKKNTNIDHPDEGVFDTKYVRLGDACIRMTLHDMQDRLNLNHLRESDEAARRIFNAIEQDPRILQAVTDWIDADDQPKEFGAEQSWYRRQNNDVLPGNALLHQIEEIQFIRGVTPALAQRLPSIMHVVPRSNTTMNINALSQDMRKLMVSAGLLQSSIMQQNDIITKEALEQFVQPDVIRLFNVRSQYFLLESRITLGDVTYLLKSLLYHPNTQIDIRNVYVMKRALQHYPYEPCQSE